MANKWVPSDDGTYEIRDRKTARQVDRHQRGPGVRLELDPAAYAEVCPGRHRDVKTEEKFVNDFVDMPRTQASEKFVNLFADFVAAWTKVMNADRFEPQCTGRRRTLADRGRRHRLGFRGP
jgi:catalase (peroxidase I)